jgi:membrane protein required for colicin V production
MTLVDVATIAVLCLSVLLGVSRGLVREVLSLLSWVAAFLAAKFFAPIGAPWFTPLSNSEDVRIVVAWVVVFVATLVVVSIVGLLISGTLKSVGLGALDRIFGALFGLARGLLIVTLCALIAGLTTLPKTEAWRKATLRSTVESLAVLARSFLPEMLAKRISFK